MKLLVGLVKCPICLDTLSSPIRQCNNGHTICKSCTSRIDHCPLCKTLMTSDRNYQLEKIRTTLQKMEVDKIPCRYANNGCKTKCPKTTLFWHELECKNQNVYICEGKKFANWNCEWKGPYEDIDRHFKTDHNEHTWTHFQTSAQMKTDLSRNVFDLHLITFNDELFWYKHKVDLTKQQAFWLCQYVGSVTAASKYYYEFSMAKGAHRAIVGKEFCQSCVADVDCIINAGKCVAIPFSTLKTFMDADGEVKFSFKIESVVDEADGLDNGKSVCNTAAANPKISPRAYSVDFQQTPPPTCPTSNRSYAPHSGTNFQFGIPQNFCFLQMPTAMPFPLSISSYWSHQTILPTNTHFSINLPTARIRPRTDLRQHQNQ